MTPEDRDASLRMVYEGCPNARAPHWSEDTDPDGPAPVPLAVTAVSGRYPDCPRATFKSGNIAALVIAAGAGQYVIRLDDKTHHTMWLEIRVSMLRAE